MPENAGFNLNGGLSASNRTKEGFGVGSGEMRPAYVGGEVEEEAKGFTGTEDGDVGTNQARN